MDLSKQGDQLQVGGVVVGVPLQLNLQARDLLAQV